MPSRTALWRAAVLEGEDPHEAAIRLKMSPGHFALEMRRLASKPAAPLTAAELRVATLRAIADDANQPGATRMRALADLRVAERQLEAERARAVTPAQPGAPAAPVTPAPRERGQGLGLIPIGPLLQPRAAHAPPPELPPEGKPEPARDLGELLAEQAHAPSAATLEPAAAAEPTAAQNTLTFDEFSARMAQCTIRELRAMGAEIGLQLSSTRETALAQLYSAWSGGATPPTAATQAVPSETRKERDARLQLKAAQRFEDQRWAKRQARNFADDNPARSGAQKWMF